MGTGRGQFRLKSVWNERPTLPDEALLAENSNTIRVPREFISHADLLRQTEAVSGALKDEIRLNFLTPTRLILNDKLLKSPDFGAFFNLLLKRLDDLAIQHAAGHERPAEELQKLWDLANRVRLTQSQTEWADVQSGSSRTGQKTWISGLVGPARYSAPAEVWRALWPWLLWGELAQVGKDTVKGNGVFRVQSAEERG